MTDRRKRLLWLIIPLLIIAADQGTKHLVRENIGRYDRIEIIDGVFMLNHVENKGAAFGIFANLPDGYRELVLSTLGGVALILVVLYSTRLSPNEWISQLGLHMIFAGAVGNMMDRFIYGSVTDFLLFELGDFSWPSFNIADSVIVLGVMLLLLDTFRPRKETEITEAAETEQDAIEAAVAGGSDDNRLTEGEPDVS